MNNNNNNNNDDTNTNKFYNHHHYYNNDNNDNNNGYSTPPEMYHLQQPLHVDAGVSRSSADFESAPRTSTDDGVVSDHRNPSYVTEGVETLLLRGGITVRSGPWLVVDHDGDDDDVSGSRRWGSAAVAAAAAARGAFADTSDGKEKELWAVEIGWFVGGGGGGGENEEEEGESGTGGFRKKNREVLTTVLDARTMAPLGAWKGSESRLFDA